jgi:two-component system sensor histidine kinase AtoS
LTAAKLREWRREREEGQAAPKAPAVSPGASVPNAEDATEMPALSRMVTGLVRQFRTPVASIEGAGWLLEDPELPADKRQEFVEIVRKESHRLNRVLSDVSDFTRPRKPRLQNVNISTLIDEIIQLATPRDEGPLYLFHKDVAPDVPPLRCDPEQIRRALLNLSLNAIQASPAGGDIDISAHVEGGDVVIRVKDHGIGIAPSNVTRIFDPFFSTHEHGLGLGLPVALHIVKEHGGKMAVEDVAGYKTCISIALPLPRVTAASA